MYWISLWYSLIYVFSKFDWLKQETRHFIWDQMSIISKYGISFFLLDWSVAVVVKIAWLHNHQNIIYILGLAICLYRTNFFYSCKGINLMWGETTLHYIMCAGRRLHSWHDCSIWDVPNGYQKINVCLLYTSRCV